MRRTTTIIVLITSFISGTGMTANAKTEGPWRGPCDGWINGEYVEHETPLVVQQNRTKHLIRCVFGIVAPAQTGTALYVGYRESHYDHEADNGSCGGVFQHDYDYWAGRVRDFFNNRWLAPYLRPGRIFSAYVNVWVTAKMVGVGGNWSAWSTA